MSDDEFLHEEPPAFGSGDNKLSPLQNYLHKLERALKRGDATERKP